MESIGGSFRHHERGAIRTRDDASNLSWNVCEFNQILDTRF